MSNERAYRWAEKRFGEKLDLENKLSSLRKITTQLQKTSKELELLYENESVSMVNRKIDESVLSVHARILKIEGRARGEIEKIKKKLADY